MTPDQRVVQENRWAGPTEQPRQPELPAGRGQQIASPNDQVYFLAGIVHYHGEMVGPISQAVSEEKIAALLGGLLDLLTHEAIHEPLGPGLDLYSYSSPRGQR
jgi:hypothetical protein